MDKTCFVIMPIGEYNTAYFRQFLEIYEDIFIPAIRKAGYIPIRADEEKACNVIQCDIIQRIIESDMVLCDLSNRNPNVLYELGIRQAFDKPVVLVQQENTERIFDISIIRTIDYDKNLNQRKVKENIDVISKAIIETAKQTKGINSIIKFINIENQIKDITDKETTNVLLNAILNRIQDLEDGQDGLYELFDNHQILPPTDNVNLKWNNLIDTYVRFSQRLTLIEEEIMGKCNYDEILEKIAWVDREIEESNLSSMYGEDLIFRISTLKRIIKWKKNNSIK
ncbi:MAG: hypothetical protein HFK04_07395 [Oscillospiraceae bacterium]|nr:hypothetical protein [Oscillospiraceae bacterium]